MISNCKVGAIVFFVSDLARSVAFYRDTLGLPVEALEGHDGPWAMGEVEGLTLVFIPRPARPGESPVVVFSHDGGIDDHAEALAAKGVEIAGRWTVAGFPRSGRQCAQPAPTGGGATQALNQVTVHRIAATSNVAMRITLMATGDIADACVKRC